MTTKVTSDLLVHTQTGTGAVQRSMKNKLGESVSVKDFGAKGDGVTDDTAAFNNAIAASKFVFVPAGTYIVAGLALASDVQLFGEGNGPLLKPPTRADRVFHVINKSNFSIEGIRTYGADEQMDGSVGGGYWLFEGCTDFRLNQVEISRTGWDGLKLKNCSRFTATGIKTNYNKSSGIAVEGCSSYVIEKWESNKNGRNSADDSFAALPPGWTGTHVGRGITVSAAGTTNVDQKYSVIRDGSAELNSEYGVRCYAGTDYYGVKNVLIENVYAVDNGHPAGTYGTITLASDKGVDILINSNALGESDNIRLRDIEVERTATYGTPVSVDGYNHRSEEVRVRLTGSAANVLHAFQLYGAKKYTAVRCQSWNANQHYILGSNSPADFTIEGDKAFDCMKFIQGQPGGVNFMRDVYAKHRTTAAVVGENGVEVSANWELRGNHFDGFHRAITLVNAAVCVIVDNTTKNSVDVGVSGGSGLTDQTNIQIHSNSFDKAYPGILASFSYNRRGGFSKRRAMWNADPVGAGVNGGGNMNWDLGDRIENGSPAAGSPKGWVCTTAGTPGTWTSEGNL